MFWVSVVHGKNPQGTPSPLPAEQLLESGRCVLKDANMCFGDVTGDVSS